MSWPASWPPRSASGWRRTDRPADSSRAVTEVGAGRPAPRRTSRSAPSARGRRTRTSCGTAFDRCAGRRPGHGRRPGPHGAAGERACGCTSSPTGTATSTTSSTTPRSRRPAARRSPFTPTTRIGSAGRTSTAYQLEPVVAEQELREGDRLGIGQLVFTCCTPRATRRDRSACTKRTVACSSPATSCSCARTAAPTCPAGTTTRWSPR